jgi:hypothetical protein
MTNVIHLQRNDGRRQQPIAISAGVTILAAIVLVCAGLLAVPLWTALVQGWQVEAIHPRSLYRSYENGPDSPSNPYAPTRTLMIE